MIPNRITLNRWRGKGWYIYGEGTEDLWMERDIWIFGSVLNYNRSKPYDSYHETIYQQIVRIKKGQWVSVTTGEMWDSASDAMRSCGKQLAALRRKYSQVLIRPPLRPVVD